MSELRAAHVQGKQFTGLDVENGEIADMKELVITESFIIRQQVLLSVSEAAEMILGMEWTILSDVPQGSVCKI